MKKSELLFTAVKPPLDLLALICAALAAYSLRYLPAVQNIRPVIFDLPFSSYFKLVLVVAISWLVIFAMSGLYSVSGFKKIHQELSRIFVACLAGIAVVLAAMVFTRSLFDSRFIILAAWLSAIIFVSIDRLIIQLLKRLAYRFGYGVRRVMIIGNSKIADDLVDTFTTKISLGYRVVGIEPFFTDTVASTLANMAAGEKLDEIIQINPNLNTDQTMALINFANEHHIDFKYTADLLGTQLTNISVATYAGAPIVEVKRTRLDGWGRIHKRIFDIIGSTILALIFLPIMFLAAIAIKLNSQGPIFFRYKRIGQFGKQFGYFKFRSMVNNAHQYRFDPEFVSSHKNVRDGSPMIKFDRDPRITRVGRFIRRFSIDELPELFLVFIGKMSLVGPRPHEIEEVGKYQRHHKKVLTIKPGITGLSQVSGRSDLNFEDEVRLDTYYIENWSLALDILILLKTPLAVLRRRQAE